MSQAGFASGKHRDLLPFTKILDTNGDGTGNINAKGDYLATPTDFFIQPPPLDIWQITQFRIHVCVAGQFPQHGYGAIAAPGLANGYTVELKDAEDVVKLNIINEVSIKDNDSFLHTGADMTLHEFQGIDNSLIVVFDFVNQAGLPLHLDGSQNEKVVVTLNDDFSALSDHHFIVIGHL